MAETHVVSALVEKRVEIAGQIIRFEQQLGQFRADLTRVDATIRLFAPDLTPDAIPAKMIRRSDGWFASDEVKRRVLDTLRRTGQPMLAPGMVRAVMVEKGLDPADHRAFATVQMKVGSNLRQLTARGLLNSSAKTSGAVLWRIADQAIRPPDPESSFAGVASIPSTRRQTTGGAELGAVWISARVLRPGHFAGILVQIRTGDMMMLTEFSTPEPGKVAFRLIGAGAIHAIGAPVVISYQACRSFQALASSAWTVLPRRHGVG